MRTPIAFIFGALAATLVAAAAFRGSGQPLESTFTYQGQLRNAGQLVNGDVDVRFTLWDSDVGGTQIGNANSFTNYPLTDGRFALGLNFGTGAFNGDQRWVQVEFRNPAGSGQYLTLAPRDKILAAPYALYALNSTASQWDYNPKTQALTSAQHVTKVGIGTNSPTAALEVVAVGGDESVKLPPSSIGLEELADVTAAATIIELSNEAVTYQFTVTTPGVLILHGDAERLPGWECTGRLLITIDEEQVPVDQGCPPHVNHCLQPYFQVDFVTARVLAAGVHQLRVELDHLGWPEEADCGSITGKLVLQFVARQLEMLPQ